MKKPDYTRRALFIILLSFFIGGMCQAQTSKDLQGVPLSESGLSEVEYTDILKRGETIILPSQCGPLTLTLTKVHGTTNDPHMKHMVVDSIPPKNNPNKPQWSGIPYIIISEEGYDENN